MSQFADGYEGVTHAGLAVVALETGQVLLAQRTFDESDDPAVQESWEFPGGGLGEGEDPQAGAIREFSEEVGPLPEGEIVDGWRAGPEENYQGFVYLVPDESGAEVESFVPNEEVQKTIWAPLSALRTFPDLRPEMRDSIDMWLPLLKAAVSGNQEEFAIMDHDEPMPESEPLLDEPELTWSDLVTFGAIPIHGVLAPEEIESGDKRGFAAGSMTQRDYRLPFMWQIAQTEGHNNSVVIGSVDRLMRKDGLIHWEGSLMPTEAASDFAAMLAHFGRFPVSVDGDSGHMDRARTDATGVLWFDAVRASGLTAVSVSAFVEAYVAYGTHAEMPPEGAALTASMQADGDLITFKRGPGWVTNPKETKRLHDYWTKKGQPGYAKIAWGTPGDFTRAKKLIGEKIGKNSPEDMKYLNQIIAQWHHDALGYWPGDLGKPGNAPDTPENRKRAARHAKASIDEPVNPDIEMSDDGWEAVLVSSAKGRVVPPASYFERHPDTGALVIEEPDENGLRRTYGYAGERGVCHIGYEGECVEMPYDPADTFEDFHLGRTKTDEGYLNTGLITYKVAHRDARRILTETAEQAHFDNIKHAWASVRLGVDERGVWFSGVVLPHVPDEDIVLIEAAGQVSGEWKFDALRGLQAVNIPGFGVLRSSAMTDDDGKVIALVASAVGSGCAPSVQERFDALKAAHLDAEAERRFLALKRQLKGE